MTTNPHRSLNLKIPLILLMVASIGLQISCAKNSSGKATTGAERVEPTTTTGDTPADETEPKQTDSKQTISKKGIAAHPWCTYVRQPKRPVELERMMLSSDGAAAFTYFYLNTDSTRAEQKSSTTGSWYINGNQLTVNLGGTPVAATIALKTAPSGKGKILLVRFKGDDRPVTYSRCE